MALACRYADEVIIGAPHILTNDLINTLNIHKVVNVPSTDDKVLNRFADIDPYAAAKAKGIYVEIAAPEGNLTIEDIAMRVYANKAELQKKFDKKSASEEAYYDNKKFVQEIASPADLVKNKSMWSQPINKVTF